MQVVFCHGLEGSPNGTKVRAMKDAGIKVDELPLGALSAERIGNARAILVRIEALHSEKPIDAGKDASEQYAQDMRVYMSKLEALSTQFYLVVPAIVPTTLETAAQMKEKSALIEMLHDICVGQSLMCAPTPSQELAQHPLDIKYESLHCAIQPLDKTGLSVHDSTLHACGYMCICVT